MHDLIKRTHIIVMCFVSCFVFWTGYTQDTLQNESIQYKRLVLDGKVSFLQVYKDHNSVSIHEDATKEEFLDVYADYWNTKVFNPYKGAKLNLPIALTFKDSVFAAPIDKKMVVTSRYGWRRGRAHKGIDIDLWVGDKVNSILDGKVRYVGYHGGHGKTVVVRHDNGLETVYAHLSKYLVKENDIIKKGEPIGIGGITGNARGSHLHLEVRYQGRCIHPEYIFEFDTDFPKIRSKKLFVTRQWLTPRSHRSTKQSDIQLCTSKEEALEITIPDKEIHRVEKGETLYGIASTYGIAISEICKINSIRRNQVLQVGQEIIVANIP